MGQQNLTSMKDGPRAGLVVINGKEVELLKKAQVRTAQDISSGVGREQLGEARGSGVASVTHPTRPPDLLSRVESDEGSGNPQFVRRSKGSRDEGEGGDAAAEGQRYDDDMPDAEASASAAGHSGQQS